MILINDKDGKNSNRIRNNIQKMGFNTFSPLITFFQQISDTRLLLTQCVCVGDRQGYIFC